MMRLILDHFTDIFSQYHHHHAPPKNKDKALTALKIPELLPTPPKNNKNGVPPPKKNSWSIPPKNKGSHS